MLSTDTLCSTAPAPAPAATPAAPREMAVQISGLEKYYGGHKVLDGIDLDVRAGERVVICGPSGSGKSTLIRCINQLEHSSSGTISIRGSALQKDGARAREALRDVGMVFQHFNLFPHMTVLENCVLAPISVRRFSRADATERAHALLKKIGLGAHTHKYPSQLSGGQQQRVAIVRALCMEPKIMLFDEPTSALDPEMVGEVLDAMVELARTGMTMLCVTHEMGFARKVAERVLFLEGGKIVEDSPSHEFFDAPKSARAQAFLQQIRH
jgi:polar amino acid transport system ATP-binding protein